MKNNSPKAIAYKTLLKNKLCSPHCFEDLERIIEAERFMVIPYKKCNNTEEVKGLIERLGIENEIEHSDSFIYIRNNLRFVFINSDVSAEDRCALLRHELGHILDPDLRGIDASRSAVKKEEFANEFSYHFKNPRLMIRVCCLLNKKIIIAVCIALLLVCTGLLSMVHLLNDRNSAKDTYYITPGGEKYHRSFCITVKNRTNLREVSAECAAEEGYEPCLLCIGE